MKNAIRRLAVRSHFTGPALRAAMTLYGKPLEVTQPGARGAVLLIPAPFDVLGPLWWAFDSGRVVQILDPDSVHAAPGPRETQPTRRRIHDMAAQSPGAWAELAPLVYADMD